MAFNQHWTLGRGHEFSPPDPKNPKGKGKGKGGGFGGGWGKGGKKGGGLIYPVMNRNVVSVWKNAQSGIVNNPIDTWTTAFVNDGSAFNLTTGVYTAPVTGYYLVSWNGHDDGLASNGVATAPIRLRKNGTTTIDETYAIVGGGASTPTHKSSSGRTRIVQLDASDTLELLQIGDEAEEVTLTIVGIYSAYWFEATKATGTGTGSGFEDIDTYDAVSAYESNYSNAFSTSTGVFTAPADGRYYLFAGGGKKLVTNDTRIRIKITRAAGNIDFDGISAATNSKTNDTFQPVSCVVELAAGDTAELQQYFKVSDEVVFGGMMLHENANWFMLNDVSGGSSSLTEPNNYAGFATREGSNIGTDWNDTTGEFTTPSGGQNLWFCTGSASPDGIDYLTASTRLRRTTLVFGKSVDETSNATTLPIRRNTWTVGAVNVTAGTDTLNMYCESSNTNDIPRFGQFCGFEPWGADL